MYRDSVFLAGNFEAQNLVNNIKNKDKYLFIRKHFIYTCLLSENVFLPAANYFQSPITKRIIDEFAVLLRSTDCFPKLVHISINPEKEDFAGEALEKSRTYLDLPKYQCYMDRFVRDRLVANLNVLTEPTWRKGKLINNLSNYIIDETMEGGFLNDKIETFCGSQDKTQKIFRPLLLAIEKNEKAIIPEYILQFDKEGAINKASENLIRASLLKAYAVSLENLYEAYVCNPLVQMYDRRDFFPYSINYLDTFLFDSFLKLFEDVNLFVTNVNGKQLRKLKYSQGFYFFIEGYKRFVEQLGILKVPRESISFLIAKEKKRQDELFYKNILNNSELASLMYSSIFGLKSVIRKLTGKTLSLKTNALLEINNDLFLYALVNEVYETFFNKYSEHLRTIIKSTNQHTKKGKEGLIVIKKNINNGGIQNVTQNSSDVHVTVQATEKRILFSANEMEQINNLAAELAGSENSELKKSEKMQLSGILYALGETASDSEDCSGKLKEFQKVFGSLRETAQEVVISVAAGVISKALLSKLGLG